MQTILIFGSTGTAGSGAVQAALDDDSVAEVRAVTRRPLGYRHAKLVEVMCAEFEELSAIRDQFRDVDACLFCLGVSVRQLPEEAAYRRVHCGFAGAAARELAAQSPDARFVLLSGAGAHPGSRMMWARVKAEAEQVVAEANANSVSVRPGYIYPLRPRLLARLTVGVLLRLVPLLGIRAYALGRAMLRQREEPSPVGNAVLRRLGVPRGRRFVGAALRTVLLALVVAATVIGVDAWPAMGKRPRGERLVRVHASPQWSSNEGIFINTPRARMSFWDAMRAAADLSGHEAPEVEVARTPIDPNRFETPPESGVRVTWFGHSILLVEIEGRRFLTDPVWGGRASPSKFFGPQRWYPPVLALEDLPSVDAVLISHDHYDHLDYPTIVKMRDWDTVFLVPLGVGAHLEYWGIPAERIIAMDWWESRKFGDVEVFATPARHFSGRGVLDRQASLWCGFAFVGTKRRVFYSGDTSMFPGFAEIGKRLGPFDITMLDGGAYNAAWADVHLGPEQAIEAHQMLRGKVYLPVHWGLFTLAPHGWTEPIERALVAARAAATTIVTPMPGESVDPLAPAPPRRWWPEVPWQTAEDAPIVSSK